MGFKICGTGSSVPETVVTNNDLTAFLDTSDEWIKTRTGICERRVMKSETLLDLAEKASLEAMRSAGLMSSDIDMIIISSLQGDFISPSMCCLLSAKLGINCTHMFDINMGCSGFIFALDMADSYLTAKKATAVLIVCAEGMSRMTDWTDRKTCILFGDAAGAVICVPGDGCIDLSLNIKGSYEHLYVGRSPNNSPFEQTEEYPPFLHMNGQEIYKFAVEAITNDIQRLLDKNAMTPNDIAYFFIHQANMRIIDSARQKLGQPEDKFPHNLEFYGNTSSASIPLLLDEINRAGLLEKDDRILLSAFGSGLTTSACILNWSF
ncbi:MAG: ketoacyl-ACP synthase III [Eubacteriales bacterium]|nr:ketoacyl-ACP synthase III [Eubacteriales bacterium]